MARITNSPLSIFDTIQTRSKSILEFDIEKDLIRTHDLGSKGDFSHLLLEFEFIKKCIAKLLELDLNVLSKEELNNLDSTLQGIVDIYLSLKNFDTLKNNEQVRQAYINSILSHKNTIIHQVADVYKMNTVIHENHDVNKDAKIQLEELTNLKFEAIEIINNITDVRESIKSAAEQTGVEKHARVFLDEANYFTKEAEKWQNRLFWAIGIIGIIAIAVLLIPHKLISDSSNAAVAVQFTISKIVLFSAAFYVLSIINKNYKAYKHNSIVNKHRHNALTTFETFNAGTSDDQTKNAILLQTTQAIFNNQNTGYNDVDADADMSTKVFEIFKSTAPNK